MNFDTCDSKNAFHFLQFLYVGFDLSVLNAVVKSYPFTTLCWVNKNENVQPDKFPQPIGQYFSHSYFKVNFSETIVS